MKLKEALLSSPGPQSRKEYIILYIKGFLMGIADLIPGVSGGTIAFISGIYESLLEAVASINKDVFKSLIKLEFSEVVRRVHLRFILTLGAGILSAIFGLARLMHYLINNQPVLTWATFFGLIAASIIVIWRHLENPFSFKSLGMTFLGALIGYVLVSVIPVDTPEGLWFIFICGCIGITAMILPGLSGSFLLLILGKYAFITGAIKNPFSSENLIIIGVFASGMATGLLGFSKFLNYCLKNFHNATMALLTGILIGSMKKVWPWREVVESKIVRGKVRVLREANIMPNQFDSEVIFAIILILIGFASVLYMESISRNRKAIAE